ncbi:MAG: hypothetical protein HFH68_13780 [Lachnospiraceae bacterium]|nr:hypothetical protein [Lachnospiraceae bacterium]
MKHVKQLLKTCFLQEASQLGGATWFLRTLFQVLLVYMVIIYISGKYNSKGLAACISGFICIAGATIVSMYNLKFPLGLHSFFAAFAAFQTGVFLHNTCLDKKFSRHKYKAIVISFLFLCLLNEYCKVDMAPGNITNIVFFKSKKVFLDNFKNK